MLKVLSVFIWIVIIYLKYEYLYKFKFFRILILLEMFLTLLFLYVGIGVFVFKLCLDIVARFSFLKLFILIFLLRIIFVTFEFVKNLINKSILPKLKIN